MLRNADGIVHRRCPDGDRAICSSSVNPNSSAAATAPRGLHRPKITAASAMKPLPEEMLALNAPEPPIGQRRAGRARRSARR